jgi:hypothetical protein
LLGDVAGLKGDDLAAEFDLDGMLDHIQGGKVRIRDPWGPLLAATTRGDVRRESLPPDVIRCWAAPQVACP